MYCADVPMFYNFSVLVGTKSNNGRSTSHKTTIDLPKVDLMHDSYW